MFTLKYHYYTSIILIIFCSATAFTKELKIGYFSAPPFVVITNNISSPKGVVIELWEEIAKEIGDTINWKQMTIARILYELKEDRLDASSMMVPTPERINNFHFSKNVWDFVQPGIAVRDSNPLRELKDIKDLEGLSIGSSSKSVITPWFKNNDIKFKNINGTNFVERLLKQLQLERIDAVYWPSIEGMRIMISRIKGNHKVRYLRSPMGPFPIKPMFPKTKKGIELSKKFDSAFIRVKQRVNYLKMKKKYTDI